MPTQDLVSRLKTYNSCLWGTLQELKRTTSLRLSSTNAEIARQKLVVKDFHAKLYVIHKDITINDRARVPLDTTELVELDVEGQKEFLHTYKLFHPTPNFDFKLRTKLPIRKYSATLFDGLVWKSKVFEEGSCTFGGEVKTQALKDGYAKVVLFGYKRDQYITEITHLREALRQLTDSKQLLTTQLEQTAAKIAELELEKEQLLTQLSDCNRDLKKMELLASGRLDTKGPEAFLQDSSISGLAAYHGLILTCKIKDNPAPKPTTAVIWLFHAFETESFATLEFLERFCQSYKKAGSDVIASSRKLTNEIRRMALDEVQRAFTSALSKVNTQQSQNEISHPRAQDLSRDAINELQRLDSGFNSTISPLKMDIMSSEKVYRARHLAIHEESLKSISHYIDLTHKELQACTASIAAVLTCHYVGVIARTRMTQTGEGSSSLGTDVWMDVYHGVKAGMQEHDWKEFPPLEGTSGQAYEASKTSSNTPKRKSIASLLFG